MTLACFCLGYLSTLLLWLARDFLREATVVTAVTAAAAASAVMIDLEISSERRNRQHMFKELKCSQFLIENKIKRFLRENEIQSFDSSSYL